MSDKEDKMKSVLIIGLGKYGNHLCEKMYELGNEIMIVDQDEEKLTDLLPMVITAQVGDCTKREIVKSLGVDNFDVCFVCIGNNFENSLVVTSLLKEAGAKYVVSEACRGMQVQFLLNNGADDVVYPIRDSAQKAGTKYGTNLVLDYIELSKGYSMYEIHPLKSWIGKSIKQIDMRAKYNVSVIATREDEEYNFAPSIDNPLEEGDSLMIVGNDEDIKKIIVK